MKKMRPHQLRWGDQEMGTTISCTERSRVEAPQKHCLFTSIHIRMCPQMCQVNYHCVWNFCEASWKCITTESVFECTENMAECQSVACLLLVSKILANVAHSILPDLTTHMHGLCQQNGAILQTPPPPPNPMGPLRLLVSLSARVNSLDNTLEGC